MSGLYDRLVGQGRAPMRGAATHVAFDTSAGGGIAGLLATIARTEPAEVPESMATVAAALGASDLVLYVADFEQQLLEPLPDRSSHEEVPHAEEVATTVAGRAFLQRSAIVIEREDGFRIFAPIVEGSDTTGVLALTAPHADETTPEQCELLGVLAGYLLAIHARTTDLYGLHRRRKAMSLAASMQWDLLPPLTLSSRRVEVAGMLEPAYEVGGDCFDYALNGSQLDFAFMDSMGHGLHSAMIAALAIGCYRHDRREGRGLDYIHRDIDASVAAEFGGSAFVTGQLGRLDLATGRLAWVNAGHPAPLLVRHGRVVGDLLGAPALPWGLGPSPHEVFTEQLEPGDSLVFYTDGVVDARSGRGEGFGSDRLRDLLGRHASDETAIALVVRFVIRAVIEHHRGVLNDDATLLMIHWKGPSSQTGS